MSAAVNAGRLDAVDLLPALLHHRWSLPVLVALGERDGARFVELARGLGVPRETLARTLAALIREGLVERNPGYGHPLRPEYCLTGRGARIAEPAGRVLDELAAAGLTSLGLNKWTLPLLGALAVAGEPARFGALLEALPGLSERALSIALKDLAAAGLVKRSLIGSYPPAAAYRPAGRGRRLAALARGLAAALLPG
jgi:DNA-binding HxlR family transcriptional regulator